MRVFRVGVQFAIFYSNSNLRFARYKYDLNIAVFLLSSIIQGYLFIRFIFGEVNVVRILLKRIDLIIVF